MGAQRLNGARQLRGSRDITADEAAGNERAADHAEALPRGQHVEYHPIELRSHGFKALWGFRACRESQAIALPGKIVEHEAPGRMRAAEEALDVAPGDRSEVRPALIRYDDALVTDGAKQPAGESA